MQLHRSNRPTATAIWAFTVLCLVITALVGAARPPSAAAQGDVSGSAGSAGSASIEAGTAARVVILDHNGSVTIIDTQTNGIVATTTIPGATQGAATPDGTTVWVVSGILGAPRALTPLDLASLTPGPAIALPTHPSDIAITPDGTTAYISTSEGQNVTPVALPSGTLGTPIPVSGNGSFQLAITPDGTTAYVITSGSLQTIDIATNTLGAPISLPPIGLGSDIAIAPDGTVAYVTAWTGPPTQGAAIPISLPSGTVGTQVDFGFRPFGVAITPDSSTAIPVGIHQDPILIDIATNAAVPTDALRTSGGDDVVVTADGSTAYITGGGNRVVDLAGMTPCRSIGDAVSGDALVVTPGSTMRTGCPPAPFVDMPLWASGAVEWAYQSDHMNGYPTNPPTFGPNNSITRAQVANLIHGVAGRPDPSQGDCEGLADVPNWAYSAICWLVEQGHASGYPTTPKTFRPNNPITRAQVANMLFSVAGSPPGSPANGFDDVLDWVDPAVDWLTDPGRSPQYATGYNTNPPTFRPDKPITRAQVTRMVCRINATPGTC